MTRTMLRRVAATIAIVAGLAVAGSTVPAQADPSTSASHSDSGQATPSDWLWKPA